MEICDYNLRETLEIIDRELVKSSQTLLFPIEVFIRSQFLLQILEGMNYLHSKDIPIIHRDLKLSNIVIKICQDGVFLKICDFGLSTNHERRLDNGETVSQSHSQNTGTPGYMAPEVEKGRKYNETSDIHCIGSIIVKMFNINVPRLFYVLYIKKRFCIQMSAFFYYQNFF